MVAGRVLPKLKTREDLKKRLSLLEECWLLVSSSILLGLSTWVSENHNEDCSLISQGGCFADWPHQHNSTPVTIALAVFLGWYCHCVLKSLVPGIGLHAGSRLSFALAPPASASPSCQSSVLSQPHTHHSHRIFRIGHGRTPLPHARAPRPRPRL